MEEAQLHDLIGRIYEAANDDEAHRDVMTRIARATGSRFLMAAMLRPGARLLDVPEWHGDLTGRMVDGIADYRAGMFASDPTVAHTIQHPTGGIFATELHIPSSEHGAHPYVKWNRHYMGGTHWRLRYELRQGVTFGLSGHPGLVDEPYGNDEACLLDLLFDHLTRAWRFSQRSVDFANETGALALVDVRGRVTAMTGLAQDIVDARDGLALQNAELTPSYAPARPAWRRLIEQATRQTGFEGSILLRRPSGKRSLSILVTSTRPGSGLKSLGGGAIIRMIDPELAPAGLGRRLASLYGLTPGEARVVEVLAANGCDLRDAADQIGITYATIRTHLSRVLAKTETRGQPELMRLAALIGSG